MSRLQTLSGPPMAGGAVGPPRAALVRAFALPTILLAVSLAFGLANDQFFTRENLLTILTDASVTGTLAFGMTFVLILAGIDLSVGSIVTITTVVLGTLVVEQQLPVGVAMALVLLFGCAIGVVNGLVVSKASVPPLIATLGMLTVLAGLASLISGGEITSLATYDSVTWLGEGRVAGVTVAALLLLALALLCHVLLTHTSFGTSVKAIGTNSTASRLMGLDVTGVTVAVYGLSGLLAAVAGLVVAGRLAAGSAEAGTGLELPAIAAAVLGGTSLFGGRGSIVGTLMGALILSVLFNGLILIGLEFFYQLVVTGVVLVLAVAANELAARRAG
jgi:ribose transport system permease protein